MLARLVTLRLWLLSAMIASACLGLAGAAVLYGRVERSHEHSADQATALAEARTMAAQVQAGADLARLAALQQLLEGGRLTVERAGHVIFRGPSEPGRDLELRVQAPFTGGVVRLVYYSSPAGSTTLELTLITAGVLALVIAAAILAATLVTRSVRSPISRAIAAADRVARGDYTARMGATGPEELSKLGRAFDGMAARLERSDADQRQFLADVAHEIATPINSVSGFAEALADGAASSPHSARKPAPSSRPKPGGWVSCSPTCASSPVWTSPTAFASGRSRLKNSVKTSQPAFALPRSRATSRSTWTHEPERSPLMFDCSKRSPPTWSPTRSDTHPQAATCKSRYENAAGSSCSPSAIAASGSPPNINSASLSGYTESTTPATEPPADRAWASRSPPEPRTASADGSNSRAQLITEANSN